MLTPPGGRHPGDAGRREGSSRLNEVEQQAHTAWTRYADLIHLGRCDVCGHDRDEYTGQLLLVARQQRRQQLECIHCWSDRTRREATAR